MRTTPEAVTSYHPLNSGSSSKSQAQPQSNRFLALRAPQDHRSLRRRKHNTSQVARIVRPVMGNQIGLWRHCRSVDYGSAARLAGLAGASSRWLGTIVLNVFFFDAATFLTESFLAIVALLVLGGQLSSSRLWLRA